MPSTLRGEEPVLGGEGWAGCGGVAGVGGGDVGRRAVATEQRRAADFAHYNPVIQVCQGVEYRRGNRQGGAWEYQRQRQ